MLLLTEMQHTLHIRQRKRERKENRHRKTEWSLGRFGDKMFEANAFREKFVSVAAHRMRSVDDNLDYHVTLCIRNPSCSYTPSVARLRRRTDRHGLVRVYRGSKELAFGNTSTGARNYP